MSNPLTLIEWLYCTALIFLRAICGRAEMLARVLHGRANVALHYVAPHYAALHYGSIHAWRR